MGTWCRIWCSGWVPGAASGVQDGYLVPHLVFMMGTWCRIWCSGWIPGATSGFQGVLVGAGWGWVRCALCSPEQRQKNALRGFHKWICERWG
eukprot:gene6872-biopygen11957